MKKMNCICSITDDYYKKTLEAMLIYSGYFNLYENERYNLEDYFDEANDVSDTILFIDEECCHRSLPSISSNRYESKKYVVYLSDSKGECMDSNVKEALNHPTLLLLEVFKYIPFSELLARINDAFNLGISINPSRQLMKGKSLMNIGLFSSRGGVGISTIGRALGNSLYRIGYKVLYFDLSPVASLYKESNDNMSRLIYSIIRGREFDLEQYTFCDKGVNYRNRGLVKDYSNLISQNGFHGIQELAIASGFDVVIFDIGNHLTDSNIGILKLMNVGICVLPQETMWTENGINCAEKICEKGAKPTFRVLNTVKRIEEVEKRKPVHNKEAESLADLVIPYQNNMDDRSMDGDFGRIIRNLTNMILRSLNG